MGRHKTNRFVLPSQIIYILVFFELFCLETFFSPGSKCFIIKDMERLFTLVGVLAALYFIYALGLGKWTYASGQKREQRKLALKQAGLSTRFYFINARTFCTLNLISGGLFTFYWLYRQWSFIQKGFKRLDGKPLAVSAWLRAVFGMVSFFGLGGIINRTCEYMRKPLSWPPVLWGILWLGGLALLLAPVSYLYKGLGYILWCAVPVVFQRRINTLTREFLPAFPRTVEIIVTLFFLLLLAAAAFLYRSFH